MGAAAFRPLPGCPKLLATIGEFCERPIAARHGLGLCEEHSREALNLRPLFSNSDAVAPRDRQCDRLCICGCGLPAQSRGLSHRCYSREYNRRRAGQPNLLGA